MFTEGKPLVSEYAYDIEAQAIIVGEAQRRGELETHLCTISTWETISEWGQQWVVLNRGTKLYEGHCYSKVYGKITDRLSSLVVETASPHNEFTFGNSARAVAAVLFKSGILYMSPKFNIEVFRRSNEFFRTLLKEYAWYY